MTSWSGAPGVGSIVTFDAAATLRADAASSTKRSSKRQRWIVSTVGAVGLSHGAMRVLRSQRSPAVWRSMG
eukprot:7389782-Prymnesium_polylepis.1